MSAAPPSAWEGAVRWLRDDRANAALVHGAYYDDPLLAACERYHASEEWIAVRRLLGRPSGDALDVGAGRGIASYALARDGFAVTALEPDPSELVGGGAIRQLVAETGLPIRIGSEVATPLPFPDASFDIVFARAVLHHLPDLAEGIADFRRLLRPGGRLVAVREHVVTTSADLPAFFDGHPLHHRYGGENAYTLAAYRDAIRDSGLELETVLNPLESAVNFAPNSRAGLCDRLAGRMPVGGGVLRRALDLPAFGDTLLRLAGAVDRRPGRLYSFVAIRR